MVEINDRRGKGELERDAPHCMQPAIGALKLVAL